MEVRDRTRTALLHFKKTGWVVLVLVLIGLWIQTQRSASYFSIFPEKERMSWLKLADASAVLTGDSSSLKKLWIFWSRDCAVCSKEGPWLEKILTKNDWSKDVHFVEMPPIASGEKLWRPSYYFKTVKHEDLPRFPIEVTGVPLAVMTDSQGRIAWVHLGSMRNEESQFTAFFRKWKSDADSPSF